METDKTDLVFCFTFLVVQSLSEQPNIKELVDQVVAKLLAEMKSPSSTSLPEGEVGSSSPVFEEGSNSASAKSLSSPSKTADEDFSSNCSKENCRIPSSEKSSPTKSQVSMCICFIKRR